MRKALPWVPLGVVVAELVTYFVLTARAANYGVALARTDLRLGAIIAAAALTMAVVGRIIIGKQPRNAIGWLFALIPCGFWVKGCSDAIVYYAHFARHDAVPGAAVAAWMSAWDYLPPIVALGVFVPLLFPEGRLPSRRWRIVAVLAMVAAAATVLTLAFTPGKLDSFHEFRNPYAPAGTLGHVIAFGGVLMALLPISFLLSAASLWFRSRSGSAIVKEQVKWIAYAGALFALGFGFAIFFNFGLLGAALVFVPVAMVPIACAIAITRYRLFEIDRLVSRTLSYGAATAILVGVSVALIFVPAAVVGSEIPNWLIAAVTLAAALAFRPFQRRAQHLIDRRFNRAKYDAEQTIDEFAARLRDEIDIDTLTDELRGVVGRSMQPASVSVWLAPR